MPTVSSRGTGLASSSDGRRLVWAEPGRLVVLDLAERTQLAELELELEPPVELAIAGTTSERLLALQAKGGGTLMRVFALPDLRPLVNVRLRGESRLAALCGSSAVLVAGDVVTIVDLAELRTATLPVRGPIQVIAQMSAEQLLVGSRGKLEAWSLDERRPTHKVGLPLPADAAFGGTLSNGRLFWFASAVEPGTVTLYRISDGKHLHDVTAGGPIKAIVADPASTTVVAAVEVERGKPLQLVVLDLQAQTRHVLPFDGAVSAFCLTGAPVDAVAIRGEQGEPVLVPLAANAVPQSLTSFTKVPLLEESAAPVVAETEAPSKPNTSRIPQAVPAPR
ncbi:MAG TPA: hypothetical protein VLB44_19970, partial [Kofleriaceae bacterium]|nr:hypothetical protein [Kofleriaceae bacterium]